MDVQTNGPLIGALVAVAVAFIGLLGRLVAKRKPKVEQEATVVGSYGKLVDDLIEQIERMEKRVVLLEAKEERLRDQLSVALDRIAELETENRQLKARLAQVE